MVKFGENISVIHKRATFDHMSILTVYEKAIEVFKDYYQYEEIQGVDRKKVEKIPAKKTTRKKKSDAES